MSSFRATQWERRPDGAFAFAYEDARWGGFVEILALPGAASEAPLDAAGEALAGLLHAALGVSYYKTSAAPEIVFETLPAAPAAEALVRALYRDGLGEFYVRNGLGYPPEHHIEFLCSSNNVRHPGRSPRASGGGEPGPAGPWRLASDSHPNGQAGPGSPAPDGLRPSSVGVRDVREGAPHAILAFGGGKDSHVALGLLEEAGWRAELAAVALSSRIARALAAMTDRSLTIVERRLDPALSAANRAGALNGHIPVTAINSLALALYAHLSGAPHVVFADERSADEATLVVGGHAVSHQYSKSFAAERLLRAAIAETGSPVDYFSVLRPFSELWIARRLAGSPEALARFRSCNRNFVQADTDAPARPWCGECAKCVFTAAITAPFLTRARSIALFGSDVLDGAAAVGHLEATLGLAGGARPWDCVGAAGETAAALDRLARDPQWSEARAVAALAPRVEAAFGAEQLAAVWDASFRCEGEHFLPTELLGLCA